MRTRAISDLRLEISNEELGTGRRRGLLALCLVVGAAVMVQAAARLPCISRDGVFFVEFAQKLAYEPLVQLRGQTKQPGYSILLLGLHSLIGRSISNNPAVSWEVCGQIIAVTGGIAVVGLVYLLTRRLFDARTGLVAALLAAFWPQLVTVSSDVLSDAPHLALYLGGMLLGVKALARVNSECGMRNAELKSSGREDRWLVLIACGAVCGLGYWLRQEALGAVGAVVVCLLWPVRGARERTAGLEDSTCPTLRQRVAQAAVVVAAFVVVVAPYSIAVGKVMPNKSIRDLLWGTEETGSADGALGRRWWERSQYAEKSKSQNGEYRAAGADESLGESQISNLKSQRAGPVTWWDAPVKMLGGWSRSGRYVLSTLALVGFFWPRAPRSDRGVRQLVVIAALLQVIAAQARGMQYGVVSERYLMIPAGLAIPWAAAGLVAIARYIHGRSAGRALNPPVVPPSQGGTISAATIAVVMAIAIGPMAYYDLRPAARGAGWEREAGAWIAVQASPGDVVNAAHQHAAVAFYAGLERRWPVEPDVAKAMKQGGAVWVVDDPGMSRMTAEEHLMVAQYRKHLRADSQSEAWRTEGRGEVKVYRIVP
jgi:dolichyl-phosphate-mannose-protein mannosyltransferase